MHRLRTGGAEASARRTRIVLSGLALLVCALTVLVSASGESHDVWLEALARVLTVAVPVAVGLYAWQRRPGERFGPLLVAAGFGWSVSSLTASTTSALYSTGRVSLWIVEAGLVYLMLSFPSGRLPERVDRNLMWAIVALVGIAYLPTALLVEHFPVPAPGTTCGDGCPPNALMVLNSEPSFVEDIVRPAREALTVLIFVAVTARLAWRVNTATSLLRRTLTPVLVVAGLRLVAFAGGFASRRADATSALTDALSWAIALALPAMALAFLAGLLAWRLFAGAALQRLAVGLRAQPGPSELRGMLAGALQDPTLRLAYWIRNSPGAWVDAEGLPVDLPRDDDPERCVTVVRNGKRRVAAIVHDRALRDQRALVDAAGSLATMALENQRLAAKVARSLRELRESRARIQATADAERRRIERDLHDGAQQGLVGLRIKLELARELMETDHARASAMLGELGEEAMAALDDVRSLAGGVYPPLLAQGGLDEALRAAALHSPIHTQVAMERGRRYSEEIESAVYFCCLEAMQNAAKHATGAGSMSVTVADNGSLHFEVGDDGAGFDTRDANEGTGITNMRDRIAAVGGQLDVSSEAGRGTRVVGDVPLG